MQQEHVMTTYDTAKQIVQHNSKDSIDTYQHQTQMTQSIDQCNTLLPSKKGACNAKWPQEQDSIVVTHGRHAG